MWHADLCEKVKPFGIYRDEVTDFLDLLCGFMLRFSIAALCRSTSLSQLDFFNVFLRSLLSFYYVKITHRVGY